MSIAIVTGASSGFGREFVRRFDAQGFDAIWVIARRKERLEALAAQCKTPVRVLPLDLTDAAALESFRQLLETEKPEVKVLVNNSGFGYFRPFAQEDLSLTLNMMALNNTALVTLTHHVLPYMAAGSEVYNIASSSAFQPVPYIGAYAATKSFVLSFSRSLNVELRPRGIRVMAVCPHWTKTEFFDTAVREDNVIVHYNFFNDTEKVVDDALKNMKRGKDVSFSGLKIRLQVLATKLLPHRAVMRIWCAQQKKPY